jgi:hypothetical protein
MRKNQHRKKIFFCYLSTKNIRSYFTSMAKVLGVKFYQQFVNTFCIENKGSSINDVTQYLIIFDNLSPISLFLLLRLEYYRHKIIDTPSPQGPWRHLWMSSNTKSRNKKLHQSYTNLDEKYLHRVCYKHNLCTNWQNHERTSFSFLISFLVLSWMNFRYFTFCKKTRTCRFQ